MCHSFPCYVACTVLLRNPLIILLRILCTREVAFLWLPLIISFSLLCFSLEILEICIFVCFLKFLAVICSNKLYIYLFSLWTPWLMYSISSLGLPLCMYWPTQWCIISSLASVHFSSFFSFLFLVIFKWPVFRFSNSFFFFFLLVEDCFGFSLVSFQSSYSLHLYCSVCVFYFLSRLIVGRIYIQHCISFKCATCWLDTFVYHSMIATIALANTSIVSHTHHFCVCVCVVGMLKIYSLNSVELYNTVFWL